MSETTLAASNAANNYTLKNNEDGSFAIKKAAVDVLTITANGNTVIKGTTTNDNATAGMVGEYLSNTNAGGALTTATAAEVCQLSLSAGDWDVQGAVTYTTAGPTTAVSWLSASINTSVALGDAQSLAALTYPAQALHTGASGQVVLPTQVTRISLAGTTVVRLIAQAYFATAGLSASGAMHARRAR